MAWEWLQYWLKQEDAHSLHSPYIYKLYTEIIKPDENAPAFEAIEKVRKQYLRSKEKIAITDLGAGSHHHSTLKRKLSAITESSSSSPKYNRLYHRLALAAQAKHIIELGACTGINTAYLASSGADITSFEGCPNLTLLAKQTLKYTQQEAHIIQGNIDETLPDYLASSPLIDMAFIDANHTYEATLRYFQLLITKMLHGGFLLIGDIHWSLGMKKAWEEIKEDPRVTLSIDLYEVGIICIQPDLPEQHYCLAY